MARQLCRFPHTDCALDKSKPGWCRSAVCCREGGTQAAADEPGRFCLCLPLPLPGPLPLLLRLLRLLPCCWCRHVWGDRIATQRMSVKQQSSEWIRAGQQHLPTAGRQADRDHACPPLQQQFVHSERSVATSTLHRPPSSAIVRVALQPSWSNSELDRGNPGRRYSFCAGFIGKWARIAQCWPQCGCGAVQCNPVRSRAVQFGTGQTYLHPYKYK